MISATLILHAAKIQQFKTFKTEGTQIKVCRYIRVIKERLGMTPKQLTGKTTEVFVNNEVPRK